MALSIIGTPAAAAASSITLPTHAIGDIIVIWAYRDGSTATPTKPAAAGTVPAWTDINNPTGANTNSARSAYFVATATNHTSGTWTNATGMAAIVIRGQAASPIGGNSQNGSTGNNTAQAPAITQTVTDGSSIILEFYGHRTVTAWSAAPAGYTRQASVATEVALNTKDSTTSDGAISQTATTSNSGYRGETIEILAVPPVNKTQTGKSRIQATTTKTQAGKANIIAPGTHLQVALEMLDAPVWSVTTGPTTFATTRMGLDTNDYDGAVYEFEAEIANADSTSRSLLLIDSSGATIATISTGDNTKATFRLADRFTVSMTPNSGADNYRLVLPQVTGNHLFRVSAARINVIQTNATKTRIQIPLGGNLNVGDTDDLHYIDSANISASYSQGSPDMYSLWHYTASSWATIPGSNAFSLEAVISTNGGSALGVELFNATDNTAISNSEILATPGANVYSRQEVTWSSDSNFVDNKDFELRAKTNGGAGGPIRIHRAALYIRLTGLNSSSAKAEIYRRFSRKGDSAETVANSETASRFKITNALYSNRVYYHESVGRESVGGTVTIQLGDTGSSDSNDTVTAVASSDINFNSPTKAIIRTSALTLNDNSRIADIWTQSSGTLIWTQGLLVVAITGNDSATLQTTQGESRIQASVSQTTLGKSRVQASTSQTQPGQSRVSASGSQTQSGESRVMASTSRTQPGKANIQNTALQTILGKARLQISTLQTALGKSRLQKAVSQTIQGLSRITANILQTVLGKARITASTSQTQASKSRVTASALQTQPGKARLTASIGQTITGKADITATTTRAQAARARIQKPVAQIIQGLSSLTANVSQTILGRARVTAATTRIILARARIIVAPGFFDQFDGSSTDSSRWVDYSGNDGAYSISGGILASLDSGYSEIDSVQHYNIAGGSMLLEIEDLSNPSQAMVGMGAEKVIGFSFGPDLACRNNGGIYEVLLNGGVEASLGTLPRWLKLQESGGTWYAYYAYADGVWVASGTLAAPEPTGSLFAYVYASNQGSITYFNLNGAYTVQAIQGLARITALTLQDQLGRARIQVSALRTILGQGRLTASVLRTVQGLARITANTARTIQALARITASTPRTVTAKSRITAATTQNTSALARVTASATKTQTALGRITASASQIIMGQGRITAAAVQTILGVAAIAVTGFTTRTIQALADISSSALRTVLARARVTAAVTRTIQALARVARVIAATTTGRGRIQRSALQTISGKSRMTASVTKTQDGKARVSSAVAISRLIQALARIRIRSTQTQTAHSRITAIKARKQHGKARLTITALRSILVLARIRRTAQVTTTGQSRITSHTSRPMTARGRLQAFIARILNGRSRITGANVQTTTGQASLAYQRTQNIQGGAFLVYSRTPVNPIPLSTDAHHALLRTLLDDTRLSSDDSSEGMGVGQESDNLSTRSSGITLSTRG